MDDEIQIKNSELTIIEEILSSNGERVPIKYRVVKCRCSCGKIITTKYRNLIRTDHIKKSCGCKNKRNTKHGDKNTPLYEVWCSMWRRVRYNDKYINISVCQEWKDYLTFKAWALDNGYCEETPSLERKDSRLNYTPDNCKFIKWKDQNKNRNTCKWWIVYGVKYDTSTEAATQHNVTPKEIRTWCDGVKYTLKDGTVRYTKTKEGCYSIKKY